MKFSSDELELRIEKCKKVLNSDANSQIFAALAECYRKKGELELALEVCSQGLSIHPDYGSGHFVMSKILFDMGNFKEAYEELMQAKSCDNPTYSMEMFECKLMVEMGNISKAQSKLKELRERDPSNSQIIAITETIKKDMHKAAGEKQAQEARRDIPEEVINQTAVSADNSKDRTDVEKLIAFLNSFPNLVGFAVVEDSDELIAASGFEDESKLDKKSVSEMLTTINENLRKVNLGEMRNCLIETKLHNLIFRDFDNYKIIIRSEKSFSLGLLNLKLSKIMADLHG
ncbi:MAG: hypothetical protein GF315_11365 [candidate division Zixibacteria bacterium]|nr:hypothetical protein [candidate division Zixibacteria bacterium]